MVDPDPSYVACRWQLVSPSEAAERAGAPVRRGVVGCCVVAIAATGLLSCSGRGRALVSTTTSTSTTRTVAPTTTTTMVAPATTAPASTVSTAPPPTAHRRSCPDSDEMVDAIGRQPEAAGGMTPDDIVSITNIICADGYAIGDINTKPALQAAQILVKNGRSGLEILTVGEVCGEGVVSPATEVKLCPDLSPPPTSTTAPPVTEPPAVMTVAQLEAEARDGVSSYEDFLGPSTGTVQATSVFCPLGTSGDTAVHEDDERLCFVEFVDGRRADVDIFVNYNHHVLVSPSVP